jgi:hypothetical protein
VVAQALLGRSLGACLRPKYLGDGVSRALSPGFIKDWLNFEGFYINLPIGGLSAGIILLFFKTPKG